MKNKKVNVEAFIEFANLSLDANQDKVEDLLAKIFLDDVTEPFDDVYYQSMILELKLFRLQVRRKSMAESDVRKTILSGVANYQRMYKENCPTMLSLGHYLKIELHMLFSIYLDAFHVFREEVINGRTFE